MSRSALHPTSAALAALALITICTLHLVAAPAVATLSALPLSRGDASIGYAAGDQTDPHIARGGDIFLAVWVDERTRVPGEDNLEYPHYRDVYAARLDADGALLDAVPIVVCDDLGDQYDPRATWNGENWLVTYETRPQTGTAVRVDAVRISPAGEILDAVPIEIDQSPVGTIDFVAAGSDGVDWVVMLKETYQSGISTETVLRGARISSEGAHLGGATTLFHPSCCYFFSRGDLAYAGGTYLLVMECIPDIYAHSGICGLRISSGLTNLDGYPFEIALTSDVFRTANVATNGTEFFVGWDRYVSYPPSATDPFAARVTTGGVSLDHPGGIELWNGTGSGPARVPHVVWDGTNWIAAWSDGQGARVARVSPGGVVLDPGGVSVPGLGVNDITDADGGVRIVWSSDDAGGEEPFDVSTAFVSSAPVAGPAAPIGVGAPSHLFVDVAAGNTDTMLVFRSDVSGARRVMAQTASGYAGAKRSEPTLLATGQHLSGPEVAWNGTLYMAAWSDEATDSIFAVRLSGDGTVLDDPPIPVMSGREPDIAAVGDDFLIVGTHEAGSATVRRVFGARVRGTDGAVVDVTPFQIGNSYARLPKIAGMINRWLVTWERRPSFTSESADVWAAFVDIDGTAAGEFGVATNQAASDAHLAPTVASGDALALIIWEETRLTHGEDWNLHARRVRIDGLLYDGADGFDVVTDPLNQRNAAACWNGSVFQVVYETTEQTDWFDYTRPEVYGTRISDTGVVLEPETFAIHGGLTYNVRPAVAGAGGGSVAAVSVFRREPPYTSYRLALTSLDDGSTGVHDEPDVSEDRTVARLAGASPNPAGRSSTVHFALYEPLHVTVELYDVGGRHVRTLHDGALPAGEHGVAWDGLDESGRAAAAGVYLYRMTAGAYRGTGKLALLR